MPNGIFTLKQQVLAIQEGAWTNQKPTAVDYLVVAGGGAGGGAYGGGGGAGGLLQGNIPVAVNSAITVTVGGGGTGSSNANGTNGSNSVFGSVVATGGGYGPAGQAAGANGGSGGGSGGNPAGRWGQGVAGQGNRGGDAGSGTGPAPGGGGGAGTRGLDGTGEGPAGNGGAGVASDISGTRTAYAGGGGGGTYLRGASGYNGTGGAGGGGAGGDSSGNNNGIAGTANTGGGGGGGSTGGGASSGGNGGSGIVIISYPDTYAAAASTTGSPTVTTSGSGSLSFSGSGQYMVAPSNAGYTLGSSGDFTIEFWIYLNAGGSSVGTTILGTIDDYNSSFLNRWWAYIGTTNFSWLGSDGNVSISTAYSLSTWTHIAFVRSGSTITGYKNGVSFGTQTTNQAYTTQASLKVAGGVANEGGKLNGYLSNVRIVKGTAVYTSNFTPPAAPLTPITNTTCLLSTISGAQFADSSTTSATFTVTGSPVWNSSSPFATGLGYKNRVYQWTSSGSITF